MGKFNKLVDKGKQMAGKYLREQLAEHQGQRPATPQERGPHQGPQAGRQRTPDPRMGTTPGRTAGPAPTADEAAIAKYKYMLHTAPPEDMERAHAEAFSRLTPAQRDALQSGLGDELPAGERPRSNRPEDLARSATRAEVSSPGFMERLLGGRGRAGSGGAGRGFGGLGAGLLAGVAGGVIGSAVAGPLLEGFSGIGEGLGEVTGELGDTVSGLGDAASGLGDTVATGGEALSGGGLLDGLLGGGGEGFLGQGGDGFFGGRANDWEL